MSLVVPLFSSHMKTSAILTANSWLDIFDTVTPEKSKRYEMCNRKIAKVRMARCNGLYVKQGDVLGIFHDSNHYWRKIYGVVLFHTQNEVDENVPFINTFQLRVGISMCYHGYLTSVSMYFTPETRIDERTYYIVNNKVNLGALIPVTNKDYEFGLNRTKKMLNWDYSPQLLKIN